MTDAQIKEIYHRALGRDIAPHHVFEAKRLIDFLFDALPQAGFDDADFEPLFKRPTWQE